jgi:polysaccharide export outer membrane protein
MRTTRLYLVLIFVSLFGLGCSSNSPKQAEDPSNLKIVGNDAEQGMTSLPDDAEYKGGAIVFPQSEYILGPLDEISVDVFLVEELSGEHTIDSRGEIRLPLLDGVRLAGKTTPEAEALLESLYGAQYLQDPKVSVRILEFGSQLVTVLGAVRDPGVYPLRARTTLLQVMAMAGGVTRVAEEEKLVLFREDEEGVVYGYLVQLDQIKMGEKKDPAIAANDRIVVPESGSSTFLRSFSIGVPGFGGYRQY